MGRINLAPLRVRKRALANQQTGKTATPVWLQVTRDIPPAQIFVRKQPQQHPLTRVRAKLFQRLGSEPSIQQTVEVIGGRPHPKRLFCPQPIKYEEDELRLRLFSDHPWELARPRVVLEDTGDSHAGVDWSKGLIQPGIPLSGESVVQRQLYLLQTVPNIKVDAAYDIVRKEFYDLRRQEEVRSRVTAEEAENSGAVFGKSPLQWGIQVENAQYDDWERWAREQVVLQQQKNAAFAGNTVASEEDALAETADTGGRAAGQVPPTIASTILSRPTERRRTPIGRVVID